MKKSLPSFALFMVYWTEVATLCNFFMFFASTDHYNYSYIQLWPWLALSALLFWGLALFLNTPRALSQVIGVTLVCGLVILVIMNLWFVQVTTLWGRGFALLFLGRTIARAPTLLLQGCESRALMFNCELPIIGICFLLWMDSYGLFYLPPYYMVCTITILLLTILSLSMARMYSIHRGQIHTAGVVGTILASFAILGGVAAFFVLFAARFASATVRTTTDILSWLYTAIATAMSALFLWFFSLFPHSKYDTSLQFEAIPEMGSGGSQTVAPQTVVVVTILALLLSAYLLLRIFLALRKKKFGRTAPVVRYHRPRQNVERVSLLVRLKAFFRRICTYVSFHTTVFWKRNTPQGAVIFLSKLGKKRGLGRGQGESYHSYLLRLAPLCASVDEKAGNSLEVLAAILDATLYAPETPTAPLRLGDYRRMRRALIKLHRST